MGSGSRFGYEAICPNSSKVLDPGKIVDGQEHDFRPRRDFSYLQGGVHTVHLRHADVHENDIGLQRHGFPDRFTSVRGLAADAERFVIEERADGGSRRGEIIHNKDSG